MTAAALEFEVLGPVRLLRDGQTARTGRLQRTLLAVLLLHGNRPVSADVLIETLWSGRPDPRSDQNLRLHVHRLRHALGDPGRLTFESGGYRLVVHPGELDAERFESFVDNAARIAEQEPERGAERVREALDLWRGRPYDGLDLPDLLGESQRLTDRRLTATELLYECELALGHETEIVGDLTDLVRRHPLRERLYALLMVALARSGRQADALQTYQNARRTLVDELGLEPGPELRTLEQRVLAGEAVLLGAATAPPPPAQLPADVRGFAGRDDVLAKLDRLLSAGDESMVIVNLTGTAGVGKSALAAHWAHRVRDRFPDGQLYIDLRGYGPDEPVEPEDALARLLRALGVEGTAVPQQLDERSARFRSTSDGRRMLVVLDNARSVDQVRPLLPGRPPSLVLITSRDSLTGLGVRDGARRINLDRLSDGEARRLMLGLVGEQVSADHAALEQLIEQCARLPLALRIAADLVETRPARGVAGLVAELTDERGRLDLLDVEDDPYSTVRAVFSWSYKQLSSDPARLFRLCGLHPGREADVFALAALAGSDHRRTRRSLDHLLRAHLLEEVRDGRFRLHDLLRAYAAELNEDVDSDTDRTDALSRLAAHYLHTASMATDLMAPQESDRRAEVATPSTPVPSLSSYDQALAWLEHEVDNLLAVAPTASDAYTTTLSELLYRYFEIRGYYDEALALTSRALAVAKRLGDVDEETNAHRLLANINYFLGDFEESIHHDELALDLCREGGTPRLEAVILVNLGTTHQRRGSYRRALRCFEQARIVDVESDRQLLPLLANTGSAQAMLGQYQPAQASLERALELANSLENRAGRVTISCLLGDLAARTGQWEEGLDYAGNALAEARAAGNRSGEADALCVLGAVYGGLDDHERSRTYFGAALGVARATGNKATIAEALNGLGRSRRAGGEAKGAVQDHHEALEIASASGIRYEEAGANAGLGDAYVDLVDHDRVRQHWQCALDIYRELGVPEANEVEAKLSMLR